LTLEKSSKKILILGGGFGGMYCAKKLECLMAKRKNIDAEIILVSRQNFFVFTPMLPQVVSGMIESNHVVVPLRQVLKNTKFYEAEVASIDVKKRKVNLWVENNNNNYNDDGHGENGSPLSDLTLDYDHLVISLGSDTNFPKSSDFAHVVFTLKNLKDALLLRNHIIDMLERADIESDLDKRRQMLNFVIVGGGLSGVETAAELNAFFHKVVKYYPNLKAKFSELPPHVTVIQSRDRILPELNSKLATDTLQKMNQDGISIILNTKVIDVGKGFVRTVTKEGEQSTIPANTVIWTVGISPNPLTASIACEKMTSGRPVVDSFLHVKGCENVWAVGDSAYIMDEISGEPFPATAQHALREAEVAAENIVNSLEKNNGLRKFKYGRDAQMALIGSKSAIANIAGINLSGFLIWCIWRVVYLKKLPMFKKRLRVALDWIIDIFFDPDLTHLRGLKEDRKFENHTKHIESR